MLYDEQAYEHDANFYDFKRGTPVIAEDKNELETGIQSVKIVGYN
jgi:hypothetical protein